MRMRPNSIVRWIRDKRKDHGIDCWSLVGRCHGSHCRRSHTGGLTSSSMPMWTGFADGGAVPPERSRKHAVAAPYQIAFLLLGQICDRTSQRFGLLCPHPAHMCCRNGTRAFRLPFRP